MKHPILYSKPDVTIMTPSFNAAGIERVLINLANKLSEIGYQVTYLVIEGDGPLRQELSDRVKLIILDNFRLRYSLISLIKFLRRYRPTYFIAGHDYVNFIVIIANILTGKYTKVLAGKHAFPNMDTKREGILGAMIPLLSKRLLVKSHKIITVSNALRNYVINDLHFPPHKVVTIYNPTIDQLFWEKSKVHLPSIPFSGSPYFIAIGRLAKVKGFDFLIRSFAKCSFETRLVIIGEGEERENIERLIISEHLSQRVLLLGEISNPYPYLRHALALLSSSTSESLGLTIIEALALSKQVISTATLGAKEVLNNGKYGKIVPIGDEAAMTAAIDDTFAQLGLSSINTISNDRWKDFTADKVIGEYEKILLV